MFTSYLKTAWRSLYKNKIVSFVNIGGIAVSMAVAMLIGLWIWDELSFNDSNRSYETIAQLARREKANGEIFISDNSNHFPVPLAAELRNNYHSYFKRVALATEAIEHILLFDNNRFSRSGMYVEPDFTAIFTFETVSGSTTGFTDPNSILLSKSLAVSLFGNANPLGKILKLNNKQDVKVTGVFADLPANNRFSEIAFLCSWNLLVSTNDYVKQNMTNWNNSSFHIFVQTEPGIALADISQHIKDAYWPRIATTEPKLADERTTLFLHPMKDWHLRSEWQNGQHAGGRIQLLWLFGMTGAFVLLLACINFMNLSTARSEKRAREVGIRKTLGSVRSQLVKQFLSESFLTVFFAFLLSIGMVFISLHGFNEIANKRISFPFFNPVFWILSMLFIVITAFVSGTYPALYLSAFRPVKVLKGTFRAGGSAAILRRVMAGLQFTVSILLIIGTFVVYQQVRHGQNRPIGYDRDGLIRISMNTPDLNGKYDVLQKELIASGGATGFAQSSSTTTTTNYYDDHFEWEGKNPAIQKMSFALMAVSYDFGKTVGWQFTSGRDFSKAYSTDNAAIVLNEAAVKYMGLLHPVGEKIKWNDKPFTVIGVIKDMITESPFKPVQQSVFFMVPDIGPVITIRLNPLLSASEAIRRIQPVFKRLNPSAPFEYKFVNEEYNLKFAVEQRIGILSALFAALAIFISCLGVFGLATFVAEQRIKEIAVRKILGAPVINLWGLLSKEFVALVVIAFSLAAPLAYYFMSQWLQKYEYRTDMAWWMFAAAGLGALAITLLTVSFQSIKAALRSPVKSLKME